MRGLWNTLSPTGRVALIVGILATAASLIVGARRDLATRDAAAIRGNPEVWDNVTRLPGGATAYLVAGRKPA